MEPTLAAGGSSRDQPGPQIRACSQRLGCRRGAVPA